MAEKKSSSKDLQDVYARFAVQGTMAAGRCFGSGHIHDTYLIQTRESGSPDYLLQRINRSIFRDVPALMDNIVRVTDHLRSKLEAVPGSNLQREVLTVVPAREGGNFFQDEAGEYWRCYLFIDDHRSYDLVPGPELACEGGRHFGRFIKLLADLPGPPLHETIAGFHDVEVHLQRLSDVLQADPCRRAAALAAEIAFIQARSEDMKCIKRLGQAGRIPLRVTHNDTKFNNILFDEQGRGLCVIDLDTVMPGYVHYDFGDAVRSGCNRASEDEPDLERVGLDMTVFREYARGFLDSLRGCLNGEETASLAFSAKLFAFMIGLRFFNDHLAGDRYFRIAYSGHNLQRARVQFRLLASMEDRFAEMEDIVSGLAESGAAVC